MKQVFSFIYKHFHRVVPLALALSFSLVGFSGCAAKNPSADLSKITIVTTNFALYDFARVYEGDDVEAKMLIAPGSESHDLEATLTDLSTISEADIFVYVGGESDKWVDDVLASLGDAGEDILCLRALDYVEPLEAAHIHDEDESEESAHEETVDEHVWTSIPNAITLIQAIGDAILRCDETKPDALTRSTEYLVDLHALDAEYRTTVENAARREIVVADRFPFVYLAEEYGITYRAAFDGCTSNVEVPLNVIYSLIEEVKTACLPAVFYIEFSDRTAADAVCEETGTASLLLHSCHNVTREEFDSGITYLDLMRQNLDHLKLALN